MVLSSKLDSILMGQSDSVFLSLLGECGRLVLGCSGFPRKTQLSSCARNPPEPAVSKAHAWPQLPLSHPGSSPASSIYNEIFWGVSWIESFPFIIEPKLAFGFLESLSLNARGEGT